jgi:hypothetical protein
MDDDRLAVLLHQAREEGRKSERKAVVKYLQTKGSVIARILGNGIEEGLHLEEDKDVHS